MATSMFYIKHAERKHQKKGNHLKQSIVMIFFVHILENYRMMQQSSLMLVGQHLNAYVETMVLKGGDLTSWTVKVCLSSLGELMMRNRVEQILIFRAFPLYKIQI